jgi:hypothetical protein
MNIRKHLAGFALFSVILGSAIFINHFLAAPTASIAVVPLNAPALPVAKTAEPVSINYETRLVSLDFINKKSYTVLSFKREGGQSAPEKLWVITYFFSPARPTGKILTSTAEILKPFARGDKLEYVATSSCEWCETASFPREAGYFARVYVLADDPDTSYPPDIDFDADITTAVPVVIQAGRKIAR